MTGSEIFGKFRRKEEDAAMKNGKRFFSILFAVALVISMLAGCGDSGKDQTESPSDTEEPSSGASKQFETLNVGTQPVTVGFPVLYAEEQGWFEEAGLDVNIVIFPTGAPINEAIAAEELDIACSGFASVYALANSDCSWLADINTAGGMGLYARKDSAIVQAGKNLADLPNVYGSAESLKGAQILEPLGTSAQFATESYLSLFGLTDGDVEQVHMEYAPAYQAFTAGEGDINSCSPPYSYNMEDDGHVEICSFEDATGVVLVDGCFARNEVIENRSEEVQLFINVLLRALDALQDEDLRFEYTIAKYAENAQDVTDEQMLKEIEDRTYCGTEYVSSDGYVFGECWGAITDFLVKVEKIAADNAPNVFASFNPTFIETAAGVSVDVYQQ